MTVVGCPAQQRERGFGGRTVRRSIQNQSETDTIIKSRHRSCATDIAQQRIELRQDGETYTLVATTKHLFIDKPLMLISTWDGDAFSLSQFHRAMAAVQADPNAYFSTMATFHQNLSGIVQQDPHAASELERGIGCLTGTLPESIAPFFRQAGKSRWRSCPSYSEMLRFNKTAALS